ncbi:hypothetical protein ACFWDI_10895 [Streptomyces sp. NPDC060064]|uniref:hypothetical protein n=1 Tax=Streptomyces sp. NPDC060064 TaxID=3347049 RepID=UPI00368486B9
MIDDGGVRTGIVTTDDWRLEQSESELRFRLSGSLVPCVFSTHRPGIAAGRALKERGQQQDQEQRNRSPMWE